MPHLFDFSAPPFSFLTAKERDKVRAAVDIVYFSTGDVVLRPGQEMGHLLVVIKGLLAEKTADDLMAIHGPGDIFGTSFLLTDSPGGAETVSCDVLEEALAYLLPRRVLLDLCRGNRSFEQFFTQSLSERIAARAEAQNTRGMASFMVAKVGQVYVHPPIFIKAGDTLHDAAMRMKADKVTSLLVQGEDGCVGVLSEADLREHALVQEKPLTTPVAGCARYDTITVEEDDFLSNAQVLMLRYNLYRLPVLRQGHVVGILELIDLLGYMSNQFHSVAVQVDRARSVDDLRGAAQALDSLLKGLHGSGVKICFLAEMVTDLNRKIQRKLYDFLMPSTLKGRCCLVVMGSEGRGEQIAKTDQDNAMVVADDVDVDCLRDICARFTEAMISFGYPPCRGNMMVSNPEWTKTQSAFCTDIYHWMVTPSETSFLKLAAFLDADAVAGDPLLLQGVRAHLFACFTDNQGFLAHFARPVNSFDTPVGFFHPLPKDKEERRIDVKKSGLFPLVHGIRALALEKRLTATSTLVRIDALVENGGVFEQDFAEALKEGFQFLMGLRVQARFSGHKRDEADAFVRADDLTRFQKDNLKDSLVIVKQFKKLVTRHFRLAQF